MKIALISEHASPLATKFGGGDAGRQHIQVAGIASALGALGLDVTIYTRRDDSELPAKTKMTENVTLVHVDAGPPEPLSEDERLPHMDEFSEKLGEDWEQEKPDIVHSYFWTSGIAALPVARVLNIPLVQTFQSLGAVKRRSQTEKGNGRATTRVRLEDRLIEQVTHIVATYTDEVAELEKLGAHPEKLSVIPCGVDVNRFMPTGSIDDHDPDIHRLVVLGRLDKNKGIDEIIIALDDIPFVELVVAGGPCANELNTNPDIQRLTGLASTHGVTDRVTFRGRIDQDSVPPLLRSADLVYCMPQHDSFGITALEAMACGRPVIAARVGGLIDTVIDGVTGVQIQSCDPQKIAAATNLLLENRPAKKSLGVNARRRVRKHYAWEKIASETHFTYNSILKKPIKSQILV